jgi:hypothetical protein
LGISVFPDYRQAGVPISAENKAASVIADIEIVFKNELNNHQTLPQSKVVFA